MKHLSCLTLILLLLPATAHAHKLKLFAAVEGKEIRGYAYVADGTRLKGVTVQVWAPQGRKAATLTTDHKGEFAFTPGERCPHRLVLWMEDGHGAEFRIPADELAEDLPAGNPPQPAGAEIRQLQQQILALRQQVDRLEEKKGLQDLIGGVGYILGLAGIAFYLKSNRK